ncbi:MAG: L-rhamnose mutarotase [Bacteroidales bacterium]|nr:L-rhamnose mutarotase [Bacteroidales bacterium]
MGKRYCLTLDLKDEPQLIREYESWHKPENIWPEIPEGIREVGILEMQIYRWKNRMVMLLETVDDFDPEKDFKRLGKLSRQQDWEKLMDRYQEKLTGANEGDKWQIMNEIFNLSDCKHQIP